MRFLLTTLLVMFALPADVALAHTGHGDAGGFMYGLVHPITGLDHILAMIAVGVLAAQLGGRALWLVPLSFVVVMAIASAVATAGLQLPLTESGIALSLIVLGLVIALPRKMPALAATAVVGVFGVLHGYVHGAEMPATAQAFAYTAGFSISTMLLHAIGVGLGLFLGLEGNRVGHHVVQAAGGMMALFGATALAGIV